MIGWLIERMEKRADREAIVQGGRTFTFGELLREFERGLAGLRVRRVKPGEIVAVIGDYSPAACGWLLALAANGNTIVPLTAAAKPRERELAELGGVDRLFELNESGPVRFESFDRPVKHDLLARLRDRGTPGLVLFTSGTTGTPKGIVHDMAKFLEKYKTERESLRTLTFLLFDHIGGLNTLFHTLANGGTVVCPSGRSPQEVCEAIERYRVELLPASPSFLNWMLLTDACRARDLSSLKMITYGTEAMAEPTLNRLREALPRVQLRQTYGLSELGILRAKSMSSGSLWVRVGGEGFETKVVDGILHIRAESAMEGYLNAESPFDEEGWFNTQDRVLVDGDYIRILGRQSEIINVGGRKVYPAEVEEVLMGMPEIADVLVKGEPNPLMGQIVAAVVNAAAPADAKLLKAKIREYCADKLEPYQVPVKIRLQSEPLYSERFKKVRSQAAPAPVRKGGGG